MSGFSNLIGAGRRAACAALVGSVFVWAAHAAEERPLPRPFFGDAQSAAPRDRLAPGARVFGPGGFQLEPMDPSGHVRQGEAQAPRKPPTREETAAAKADALKKALAPKPTPASLRATALDGLFKRLAAADEADVARAVAGAIERVWLRTDSATAGLLMDRAVGALGAGRFPLAAEVLDKVIELEPDWAEAWNKRATVRFLAGDVDGAMADIDQVLKREPRHFGALVALGAILRKSGFDARALDVFRKVLTLYPAQPELVTQVEKLTIEVEGQEL